MSVLVAQCDEVAAEELGVLGLGRARTSLTARVTALAGTERRRRPR
jgi:hypothetical protein